MGYVLFDKEIDGRDKAAQSGTRAAVAQLAQNRGVAIRAAAFSSGRELQRFYLGTAFL